MTVSSRSGGGADGPISVLHVDDDSAFLSATASFLRGYEDIRVESLTDPEAALHRLGETAFDCLVSDYGLADRSGIDLLDAARSRKPGLPFIFYTGRSSREFASDAIADGVTDYLRKEVNPHNYELLATRIRSAVGSYRTQQRAEALEHVMDAVRSANQALQARTGEELFDDVAEALSGAGPYVAVVVVRWDDVQGSVQAEAWAGVEASPLAASGDVTIEVSVADAAVRSGRSQYRQDLVADPLEIPTALRPGVDFRSILAVPLLVAEEPVGALVVYGADPFSFDAAERGLLEAVARDVGFALDAIALQDRLRARTAELESYETVFETATDGLFLIDAAEEGFTVSELNQSQRDFWGVADADVSGRPLRTLVDGDQADLALEHCQACLDRAASVSYEHVTAARTTRTNLSPVVSDGAVTHVAGVTRDITPLTRTQIELELLNRVLRHDIRNDMQVVLGWAALLGDRVDAEDAAYVERIQSTAEHIVELTDVAREFAEAVVANADAVLEPTALLAVLEAEVEKAREAYADATFTLEAPSSEPTVMANEMLASVFRNVLANAVQHNDAADPLVDVRLTEREGTATVRIVDDGPGIPPSSREAVLGKGEHGIDSSGTGIGLYLVDSLVTLYGGTVRIEDDDPGAAVVIELPAI